MNSRRALPLVLMILCGGCCDDHDRGPAPNAAVPALTGVVFGTVRLSGQFKLEPGPIVFPGLPDCGGKPVDPSKLETLSLGDGNSMANVYVAVKSGLGSRRFSTPTKPIVLDQIGCVYVPRVFGLMTNQPFVIRNSDDVMHNVHIRPNYGVPFNRGQPVKGAEQTLRFSKPEIAIVIKCDVHPWMTGWAHVSEHPFFAVTGSDGKYSIAGLPPGEYEIIAWHERFQNSPLVAKVRVAANQTSTLDFTFVAPRR